ncbi:hypothetical protein MJO28_003239 [Puccinia striiformis f. sp. tritici]|uniref:Uncharacterized protein n=1 Tax=Puccinia striiformis f. sp. tritici TaxID=168172 RepID=A0ACC0ETP4_9BASI|nr:hypothetical protein MJO28_003239 [Puccinia striiformis f. sp. tritici]
MTKNLTTYHKTKTCNLPPALIAQRRCLKGKPAETDYFPPESDSQPTSSSFINTAQRFFLI